jgi:hypothetical protein
MASVSKYLYFHLFGAVDPGQHKGQRYTTGIEKKVNISRVGVLGEGFVRFTIFKCNISSFYVIYT